MKVSVITVNFNHKIGLEHTLKSVKAQTCLDFEYIIIDGGSTDGSKEVIEDFHRHQSLPGFNYVSEPDKGIYDGMNKGIAMATGEYLLFMNSGDCFSSNQVLASFCSMRMHTADLIVGRQHYIRNGRKSVCRRTFAEEVNERFLISNTLPHQATFIKRELMQKVGGYRLDFRVVADWVFWYEAVVDHKAKVEDVDLFVADMEEEKTSGNVDKCRTEMARFLMEKKASLDIEDWKRIIEENNQAYMYRRAIKSPISKLLVKIALRLNR